MSLLNFQSLKHLLRSFPRDLDRFHGHSLKLATISMKTHLMCTNQFWGKSLYKFVTIQFFCLHCQLASPVALLPARSGRKKTIVDLPVGPVVAQDLGGDGIVVDGHLLELLLQGEAGVVRTEHLGGKRNQVFFV